MTRVLRRSVLGAVAATVAACGGEFGPINDLPRELSVAEQALVDADNRFAFKLFREIVAQEESGANVFVSPVSVAMALGMTYNGARGATRDAMQAVLELQAMDLQQVNEAYASLIALLRGLDPAVEFRIANSIWHRLDLPVRQAFIDLNQQYFAAQVTGLDFSLPSAAPTINEWVNVNTSGRITEIVDDPIDSDLVMFLINAIYFKGDWTFQFDKRLTSSENFQRADGSEVTVARMKHEGEIPFHYTFDNGVQVGDLAYGGGPYRMTVVLPPDPGALDALLADLTRERWDQWVSALDSIEGYVELPKFTLEYAVELKDVLTALGMGVAFRDGEADLSGIAMEPGQLFISKVKHKTFVSVDEEGTEAAAVTSVGIVPTSGPPSFIVDRPFFFVLRERLSGTILFMGKIADPSVLTPN